MSELKGGRFGKRVPTRHNNGGSRTDSTGPYSRLVRSIANKLPVEPRQVTNRPLWGAARRGVPPSHLTDDQVREIRRKREIDGWTFKQVWAAYATLLPSRKYLSRILGYQTRGLIFPEDAIGVKRK